MSGDDSKNNGEIEWLDGADLQSSLFPYHDYWQFRNGQDGKTFIQTKHAYEDQSWHLAYFSDNEGPEYFLEITKDPKSIVKAIAKLADKDWVDLEAVTKALLPAMRTILEGYPEPKQVRGKGKDDSVNEP